MSISSISSGASAAYGLSNAPATPKPRPAKTADDASTANNASAQPSSAPETSQPEQAYRPLPAPPDLVDVQQVIDESQSQLLSILPRLA